MRFIILAAVLCGMLTASAGAQVELANQDDLNSGIPKYSEEYLDFWAGGKNLTRVDVFIQLPYTTIQFVKNDSTFEANYTITISVSNEDNDNLISEKTWNSRIETKNYNETVSQKNFTLNMRSFYLHPGSYVVRTSVFDKESNKDMPYVKKITVRDLSGVYAISDIMLLNKRVEEEGKNKITPNVSHNVAYIQDGLPIFYEIYSQKPEQLSIIYKIVDKKNNEVFADTAAKRVDTGKTQIFYTLKDSSFSFGYYTLKISITDSANNELASVSKSFFSRWVGMPVAITDIDNAVDEMVYIASSSEISLIKKAKTKEEKLKLFKEFWKTQDPTPSTKENEVFDEYYRRVAYANAHFSRYFQGWRTDMGMVFILLGPPNNVERHPFDIDSKPYEIWSYYQLNRSLVFIDETGFGDYRLITPLTGDLYKFRR